VHLGFVYARDTSLATAKLMVAGALSFETLLRQWLGETLADLPTSLPAHYVVHREGLVAPVEFEHHGQRVAALLQAAGENGCGAYFGRDFRRPPERLSQDTFTAHYRSETVAAAFRTEEISIDTEALARRVRRRLAEEPNIRCYTGRRVVALRDASRSLVVTSVTDGRSDSEGYEHVVNALWSGRLPIDEQLGLSPQPGWSFRFKYVLRARTTPGALPPSTTIVLGPFGDVTSFADGSIGLSWYPAGLTAWSTSLVPPEIPFELAGSAAASLRAGILDGLATVIPEVEAIELKDAEARGGWIFAWGNTDINDPGSSLHRRTAVGVRRQGRYLTVNTGKLTLAPLFAERAVKQLLD
jgi:hypothetical protein